MSALDGFYPEYKKVSEAPNLYALESRAYREKRSLHSVLEEEKLVRYKAIDSSGGVFLLQNPALLTVQCHAFAERIIDIVRERVGTIKESKNGAKLIGTQRSEALAI